MLHQLRTRLRPLVPVRYQPRVTTAVLAIAGTVLRGSRVRCPCCGSGYRRFLDYPEPLCPGCGSYARHRALSLYLDLHPELLAPPPRTLHVAPERCLRERLQGASAEYVSIDLEPGRAQHVMDVTMLAVADRSFRFILCSHVLQDVPERQQAMRELLRVLDPDGVAVVLWPLLTNHEAEPELEAAGFHVSVVHVRDEVEPDVATSNGILPDDVLYLCRRRSNGRHHSSADAASRPR